MQIPLTVSFRNMGHSDRIESEIQKRVEKLEELSQDIISCRVVVELPHKHHRQGNQYLVRIDLSLPEKEIIVNKESAGNAEAEDFQALLRDAFDAAKRQLHDYNEKRRKKVKAHSSHPRAKVTKVFDDGYGFIETEDGREIYFHMNSLLSEGDSLEIGSEVDYVEGEGEKGPQVSSMKVVSK